MINQNLLLPSLTLFILIHFLQISYAKQNPPCDPPSACGNIQNISYPFRLKDDPQHCGDSRYELACENNITSLYLNSNRYHVQAINYPNFTIDLVDTSIKNNSCSFPQHPLNDHIVGTDYNFYGNSIRSENIIFISCKYPLKNYSLFTEISHCADRDNDISNSSNGKYMYIKVGDSYASKLEDMCTIDLVAKTSWQFKNYSNISLYEIHDSLLYRFQLSWLRYDEDWCEIPYLSMEFKCVSSISQFSTESWCARLPHKSFECGHFKWYYDALNGVLTYLPYIIVIFAVVVLGARILIGIPCIWGLLIYKFRRRHLSMFDVIEGFLQSHNNLMPIRYSYSDIKKMTRGFREKLGEGGYGSVYKGKLRSGHDVAVKVLSKPSANGQDFINEVATIGRIHHINVVKLVGYCAERSRRALVYDFMPNGSLEKYIFNQERKNSLNWQRKYEIAVGVARGIGYLHRGCDIQILHFDIKPHNILLDDNFTPKISDFGLAKFYSTESNTVTLTAARGTIGYVAPELINRSIGGVTYKADVYSFGMLLMGMVGLNRDLIVNDDNSSQYFPYCIYDWFNKGKDIEVGNADENDDDDDDRTRKITRKMTIVALWCIQMSPGDRPSMSKVVEMLEGEDELLQIPPRPSQSPPVAQDEDQTWGTCSTDSISLLCHDA